MASCPRVTSASALPAGFGMTRPECECVMTSLQVRHRQLRLKTGDETNNPDVGRYSLATKAMSSKSVLGESSSKNALTRHSPHDVSAPVWIRHSAPQTGPLCRAGYAYTGRDIGKHDDGAASRRPLICQVLAPGNTRVDLAGATQCDGISRH